MNILKIIALISFSIGLFACHMKNSGKENSHTTFNQQIPNPFFNFKNILEEQDYYKNQTILYYIPPSECGLCSQTSVMDSLFKSHRSTNNFNISVVIDPRTSELVKKQISIIANKYNLSANIFLTDKLIKLPIIQLLKIELKNGKVEKMYNCELNKSVFP